MAQIVNDGQRLYTNREPRFHDKGLPFDVLWVTHAEYAEPKRGVIIASSLNDARDKAVVALAEEGGDIDTTEIFIRPF